MVRLFQALISTLFVSSVKGARISYEGAEEEVDNQPVWNFGGLMANPNPLGPLIPGLVPPPGTSFEVVNREMELGVGNNYHWAFVTINQGNQIIPVNQWFADIQSDGFFGVFSGTRRTAVRNNLGQEMFIIEASRPSTTTSWRILNPFTNQILFTINKDFWGVGFLGARDEWRIYRGRERDGQQIYYIVSDYSDHNHQFFHNEAEYQNSARACAQSRQYTRGGTYTQGFVSDSIGARVDAGEDTALILSTTVVIDMFNEVRAANQRAANARAQEEQLSGHRRRRGGDGYDDRRRRGVTVQVNVRENNRAERRADRSAARRANRRANRRAARERRENRREGRQNDRQNRRENRGRRRD